MKLEVKRSESSSWDEVGNKYPIDSDFLWQTMEGDILTVKMMHTPHLWNSLKMIWNHTVPVMYQLLPFKPYGYIDKWPQPIRRKAVRNLFNELMNREAMLPDYIKEGLLIIAGHLSTLGTSYLKDQPICLENQTDRKPTTK